MKKKILALITSFSIVLSTALPAFCLAEELYTQGENNSSNTISTTNLTFEVPEVWEFQDLEVEDDSTLYTFKTSNETLFIYDSRYEDAYDENIAIMYDLIVGVIASGFSDYDGYIPLADEKVEIDGCYAKVNKFICNLDGVTHYFEITSVNTGYSVVDFSYCRYVGDEEKGLDALNEMIWNLKMGENEKADHEEAEYSAGIYKVGADIPAGEYVVYANDGRGYFCVSSDSNQDDITFNDNFEYNSIITVHDGEYLELSRCYAVPVEENPEIDLSGPGVFRVGTDIPAGEYKLQVTGGMGYYCIYPDSRQDDIIANDNFDSQNYVTVSDGQYLLLSRCKFAETPEKPIKSYSDVDTVKKVQESLNSNGYDCGTPDGIAGSGTKGQIEKYQTDKGLTVTGTITDEVLNSLGIE